MRAVKIEDEEIERMAADEGLEVLKPELGTRPRVWYRNLWRYSTAFIGGSVSTEANGVIDCVEGAKVTLSQNGTSVAEIETDNYGDFKFDRLKENSGAYKVEIAANGHAAKTLEVDLTDSVYLGEIRL